MAKNSQEFTNVLAEDEPKKRDLDAEVKALAKEGKVVYIVDGVLKDPDGNVIE